MRAFRSAFLALLMLLALSACGRNDSTYRTHGDVFGTVVDVSIYGEPEARANRLGERVMEEFARLHKKFHAWKPSELTALNEAIARGETYEADAEMVALLQAAARLAEDSGHTFNPAAGRLIRLWGFQTSDIRPKSPPHEEIRRLVDARPRMSDLVFDGTRISSRNPAVMLDLGGYAKGYALDRAAHILRAEGVEAALINVGGNLMAIGQPGDRLWTVGIQDPRGPGMLATVELKDGEAVGTSGDYQRYFMKDGRRHAHIIDPRTGETSDVVAAVTIITSGGKDAGMRSDGYTKPLFVAGPEQWQDMAARLGLKEVMLIDARKNIMTTPAMRERLSGGRAQNG